MDNTMKEMISITQVKVSEDEIEAVVDVLRSGKLVAGKKCAEFEKRFAEHTGAKFAVSVNSGTTALYLAYSLVLQPGDEVLVPSFTFFATASMIVAAGAVPVFCDIDPETFTIDTRELEAKLSSRVKAIAPVHIFGNACNMDEILDFANANSLTLVWDAAQAHGTEYRDKGLGSFDDLTCYSFYPSKNMTTGEGGMVTTNNKEYYDSLKLARSQGQPRKYYHTMIGYNFRMTDFQAAMGIGQLAKLAGWIEQRRKNAQEISSGLSDLERIIIQREQGSCRHSYHQYGVQLKGTGGHQMRDAFVDQLKQKGVMAGVHYPIPLHKQPVFESRFGDFNLPRSEALAENVITLPVHPYLTNVDLERVVEAFRDTYDKLLKDTV